MRLGSPNWGPPVRLKGAPALPLHLSKVVFGGEQALSCNDSV